jgi:hypothetical protein
MNEPPSEESIPISDLFDREQSVHGDFVGGDKIVFSDLGGSSSVAIGRGAQSSILQQQNMRSPDVVELFRSIYLSIQLRPDEPGIGKDELVQLVQHIQDEVAKGDQANSQRLERWLKQLEQYASDVFQQTVEVLASPMVNSISIHQLLIQFDSEVEKVALPGVDEIKQRLENGPWPADAKAQLVDKVELIHNEIQTGDKADLGEVAYAIEQLVAADPGLRQPLAAWLVDSESIPRPVRIIAKKMLAF